MDDLQWSEVDLADYISMTGLDELLDANAEALPRTRTEPVSPHAAHAIGPQWSDLARLHRLARYRRATTVLEFGCGWSTLVLAHALRMNREDFGASTLAKLRRSNPYEIHSVDDIPQFIEQARARMPSDLLSLTTFTLSEVHMTTFGGRICTEYDVLPNVSPDLVYLDAPSQGSAIGSVNGITTAHLDRTPMACDLLKVEHFLLPGTLIVVDGRTANARFLRSNFQRRWSYTHDVEGDVHFFELTETPLGRHNRNQIELCLGSEWLNRTEG